jgi:hypothetical protein
MVHPRLAARLRDLCVLGPLVKYRSLSTYAPDSRGVGNLDRRSQEIRQLGATELIPERGPGATPEWRCHTWSESFHGS